METLPIPNSANTNPWLVFVLKEVTRQAHFCQALVLLAVRPAEGPRLPLQSFCQLFMYMNLESYKLVFSICHGVGKSIYIHLLSCSGTPSLPTMSHSHLPEATTLFLHLGSDLYPFQISHESLPVPRDLF